MHLFSIIQNTKTNAKEEPVDDYCLFLKDIIVIIDRVRYFDYCLSPEFAESVYSHLTFYGHTDGTFFYARMCTDLIRDYVRKNCNEPDIK